jgi:hypothetical protein
MTDKNYYFTSGRYTANLRFVLHVPKKIIKKFCSISIRRTKKKTPKFQNN